MSDAPHDRIISKLAIVQLGKEKAGQWTWALELQDMC